MSSLQLSAPLRFHLADWFFAETKHPASSRGEVQSPAVPPCLLLSAVYRPPPRRGLLSQSPDRSPTRLRGEFGNLPVPTLQHRRLSGTERQLRTTPRQCL